MMRDVVGYEGLYKVTSCGKVWSCRRKRFLTSSGEEGNYLIVTLTKDGKSRSEYVHRIVAKAYVYNPDPDNLTDVNHKDEVKDHNWCTNLEWCTRLYNINYGNRTDKTSKPVYCVELHKTFPSINEAARKLGLCQANLSCVLRGHGKSIKGYHFRYADTQSEQGKKLD